jgi:hypothetical protein
MVLLLKCYKLLLHYIENSKLALIMEINFFEIEDIKLYQKPLRKRSPEEKGVFFSVQNIVALRVKDAYSFSNHCAMIKLSNHYTQI